MNKLLHLFCAGLLAGCAAMPMPEDSISSPASPSAPESRIVVEQSPLRSDETSRAIAASLGGTKAQTAAPSIPSGRVSYTCPMHPEIHQDQPGKCAKCGMDLVAEGAR